MCPTTSSRLAKFLFTYLSEAKSFGMTPGALRAFDLCPRLFHIKALGEESFQISVPSLAKSLFMPRPQACGRVGDSLGGEGGTRWLR